MGSGLSSKHHAPRPAGSKLSSTNSRAAQLRAANKRDIERNLQRGMNRTGHDKSIVGVTPGAGGPNTLQQNCHGQVAKYARTRLLVEGDKS